VLARHTIGHKPYAGSTDSDGYPTGDVYSDAVDRPAYGWYPLSSQLNPTGEYDRRIITSKVVGVPNPTLYKARDVVVLDGEEYFVSEDVRDYNHGPFSEAPGGEIVVEKVTG
jgi:hypothetical protein